MLTSLDGMYNRIINKIKWQKWDLEFYQCVLLVATLTYCLLYLAEVGGLFKLSEQIIKLVENVYKIMVKCGSFLTV